MDKQIYDIVDSVLNLTMHKYQKSWTDYFDKRYYRILAVVFMFSITLMIYLANRDYSLSKELFEKKLHEEYIETLLKSREVRLQIEDEEEIIPEEKLLPAPEPVVSEFVFFGDEQKMFKFNIQDETLNQELLDAVNAGKDEYFNLPDLAYEEYETVDILIAVKNKSNIGGYLNPLPISPAPEKDIPDHQEWDPWPFTVQRQGRELLNPTEEMIQREEKIKGWRDPDEISIAMQSRERMIEYCFRREAKNYSDLHGYVLVRFIILHSGIVDPASVQIKESTLFNKRIELCIKNALKRYRGFESLDKSMGSVAVVQKFIFN